jgi:hypothetical protein
LLGVSLAYLGRKADAVREGRRGVELVGEPEKALDQLEPLLRMPEGVATPAAGRGGAFAAGSRLNLHEAVAAVRNKLDAHAQAGLGRGSDMKAR